MFMAQKEESYNFLLFTPMRYGQVLNIKWLLI